MTMGAGSIGAVPRQTCCRLLQWNLRTWTPGIFVGWLVLFGGRSAERGFPLNSVPRVLGALQGRGVDAHAFDPAARQLDELTTFDRAFIALHGRYGEDGTIQGALELMGIPYTRQWRDGLGAGHGQMAQQVALACRGWPSIPDYLLLDRASDFSAVAANWDCRCSSSRPAKGSSIGISKGHSRARPRCSVRDGSQIRFPTGDRRARDPRGEYTVAILGEQALPIIKIEAGTDFYDYEARSTCVTTPATTALRPPGES